MKEFKEYLEETRESGKKYETIEDKKTGLLRIKALKDFTLPNGRYAVLKGDEGGLIENEKNLSQEGTCWVHEDARVTGNARVYGDAQILDRAHVYGDAQVYGKAHVYDKAEVSGLWKR